ncbi:SDR family NAD(P)-dependent oxidoreductase [Sphingobium fuliginis]|uniref:SDR family oxidoreductase n=1 Tax=Sphingobium fuliginis ATCC 27551 TaxID=1208342 RepID=A0A5B8CJG1_SPHSA|nr:SDR family NAD(P)-dependent oxidoreductase [Sphingobium fuliginis]QDC38260.1 SDR family oxidoreductase [Sphingobium fuliginis ATCC 27551]
MNIDLSKMFAGRTALVTGAGQGVGRGVALRLASMGCAIAVNDIFRERADDVAAEINAAGGRSIAAVTDICRHEEVEAMFERTAAELGPVDILINNAGVLPEIRAEQKARPLFWETSVSEQVKQVNLNVHGSMFCAREALKQMVPRRRGKIINIISEAGRAGEARLALYSAAKSAMLGFTKSLALEHGRDAINVNAIALGAVSHEGIKFGPLAHGADSASDPTWKAMSKKYPMAQGLGRMGTPDDVAAAVVFLASDEAAFVTGQILGVSGGYYMP